MGKLVASLVLALSCAGMATAAEPTSADDPATTDAAAYKPRTKHDNTPYRFNMEQGGKRMTADQFDAWMKSKGVRVAKGPATTAASTATAATDVATAPEVQAAE